jgi:hypothetical protein
VRRPRFLLVFALIFASCRSTPDLFPQVVAGWHRTTISELPDHGLAASYEGPGKLEARVYHFPSPVAALESAQSHKPEPDTVFFNSGPYLVQIHWQTADRKALHEFVAGLEEHMAADKRR